MAVSYNILPPLDPLTNFTVTKISGSQTADTYDFMAVVFDANRTPQLFAARQSPPLYVIGVTLNGSQGVQFDVEWHANHTANMSVYFWVKKTGTTSWVISPTGGGLLKNGSYTNSYIVNPATQLQVQYWTLTYYYNTPAALNVTANPYDLNNQKGCAVIQLKGAWGTSSNQLKLVFDAIKTGGLLDSEIYFYNNANHFAGYVGIECINTLTGTVDIGKMQLWLMAFDTGYRVTDGRNYSVISYGNTADGAVIMCPLYAGSAQYAAFYKCIFIGATIEEGSAGFQGIWGGMQTFVYDGIFKNCKLHVGNFNLPAINTFNNTTLFASGLISSISNALYCNPFTLIAGTIRVDWDYYEQHYRDLKMFSASNWCLDYRVSSSAIKRAHTFLDCEFNKVNSVYDVLATYDYPWDALWYYVQTYPTVNNTMVYIEHSFNCKVIDNAGNAINNATIKIYNKNGLQHTLTTNASGSTTEQIIRTKEITHKNNPANGQYGSNYFNLIELAPFTIIVEKEGYITETYNLPSITTKLNWTVCLNSGLSISGVSITDCTTKDGTDGSIQVTAENGTSPYQYSLNGTTWQDSDTFTALAAGEYTVYVKDENDSQDSMAGIKVGEPVLSFLKVEDLNTGVEALELTTAITEENITAEIIETLSVTLETIDISAQVETINIQANV